jgi:hypothetical protein
MKDLSINMVAVAGFRTFCTVVFDYWGPCIRYCTEGIARWRRTQERLAAAQQHTNCCCVAIEYTDGSDICCASCCPGVRSWFSGWACCRRWCGSWCAWRCAWRQGGSRDDADLGYEMYGAHNDPEQKFDDSNAGSGSPNSLQDEILAQDDKPSYSLLYDFHNDICDRVLNLLLACMFSSALPAAATMICVNEWFWGRGQGWRWLYKYKRVLNARHSSTLGIWTTLMSVSCAIASCTNAALVCFTMQNFSAWSATNTLLLFIAFHWSLLLLQYVLSCSQSSNQSRHSGPQDCVVSDWAGIQRARATFIEKKLIHKISDDVVSPHSIL